MRLLRLLALALPALAACSDGGTQTARARLEVSPDRLSFATNAGSTRRASLQLTNSGGMVLRVTGLAVRGDARGSFRVASEGAFEVPGGGTAKVDIDYAPEAPGDDHARLVISSSADNAPEREVPLEGHAAGTDPGADGGWIDAGGPDGGPADGGSADGGSFDGGTADGGPADAGTPVGPLPADCMQPGAEQVVGTATGGVSDIAFAATDDGLVLGWWTDARELQVRRLSADGEPLGEQRTVFSSPASRFPVYSLAAAGHGAGAIFLASESTSFAEKVHRVDFADTGTASAELDSGNTIDAIAATESAAGTALLWKRNSLQVHSVQLLRAGASPLDARDTGLPAQNVFGHSLVPEGAGYLVAWHGTVNEVSAIRAARLGADGLKVGEARAVSVGGTKNVRPSLVFTGAGAAVAWLQDSAGTRSAAVARVGDDLASIDGDLVLGAAGPSSAGLGAVAAAASGGIAGVIWQRFDGSSALGLTARALDRGTGRLGAAYDVDRATLATYTDLALAPGAHGFVGAFVERDGSNSRIVTLRFDCR